MRPYLLVAAVLQVVESFAAFDLTVSLARFPSPFYAAHTIVTHLWDYAFRRFEMGHTSTIAVVLFLATHGLNRLLAMGEA
jgi:multiple sugar transport system permease protein